MKIQITDNTDFALGQTLYVYDDDYAFHMDGSYLTGGVSPDLTLDGTVHVVSDLDGETVSGVYTENEYGFLHIDGKATLTVDATGANELAVGFNADAISPMFLNHGLVEVSSLNGGAIGILDADPDFDFQNFGTIDVSGEFATGINSLNGGIFTNAGTLSVTGVENAVAMTFTYFATVNNSGTIEAHTTDPFAASAAIVLPNDQAFTINNSGLIKGDYAIATFQYVDGESASEVHLNNTGTISGIIDLESYNIVGNGPDDVFVNQGTIHGTVLLGEGADSYDGTGGVQLGTVFGGLGDDTLIGTSGDDVLSGDQNNDIITGGQGNDVADGGTGYDIFKLSGPQANYTVTPTGNNGYTVTDHVGQDGTDTVFNIETLQFSDGVMHLGATIVGTNNGETLFGTPGNDDMYGYGGDDVVNGGAGNDILHGDTGTDILNGGAGDDVMVAGFGFQTFNGGAGNDTLSFENNVIGITYDLRAPLYFEKATYVENLIGSSFDDVLTGTDGNNSLQGGDGNDILDGAKGNDVLDGGAGLDYASYQTAVGRVFVSLALQGSAQNTGAAGFDTLNNMEGLIGSNYNDVLTGTAGNDVLDGGLGDDVLRGNGGFDTVSYASFVPTNTTGVTVSLALQGHAQNTLTMGSDTLVGFEGIIGTSVNDNLTGDAHDNVIAGGFGQNFIDGGAGNDTVVFDGDMDSYSITTFGPLIDGSTGDVLVSGVNVFTSTANVEFLQFQDQTIAVSSLTFAVTLTGTALDDHLVGGNGDDTLLGGDGNDVLQGGLGTDDLEGGAGIDTAVFAGDYDLYTVIYVPGADNSFVEGPDGVDNLEGVEFLQFADRTVAIDTQPDVTPVGTNGVDNFMLGPEDNVFFARAGNDTIDGGGGNDVIDGGPGDDVLNGGDGINTVSYAADDSGVTVNLAITGPQDTHGQGIDTLSDFQNLTGSAFNDVLTGDAGNNIIEGGAGNDVLAGGGGIDTASYETAGAAVRVNLSLAVAQNTGGAGTDTLSGFTNLTGSVWNDTLTGNSGDNTIAGGNGNDVLNGGDGNDVLIGGLGADQLTGGAGADTFKFLSAQDTTLTSHDTIMDLADQDTIDLSAIDADTTHDGDQAFTLVTSFHHIAGEMRLVYSAANNSTALNMDTNGDGVADLTITIKGDHHAFTNFIF